MTVIATIDHFEEISDPKGGRPVTYYWITVRTFTEEPRQIKKRYSEFLTLHQSLQGAYASVRQFPFPKKSFYGGSSQTERMIAFEEYLHLVLEINPIPTEVLQFLGIYDGIEGASALSSSSARPGLNPIASLGSSFFSKATPMSAKVIGDSTPTIAPHHVERYLTGFVYTLCTCFIISTSVLVSSIVRAHWQGTLSFIDYFESMITGFPQAALRGVFAWKFACEVLIGFIIVLAFMHRLLGFAVQIYIARLLGTPHGAFNMKFGWISLRLGLDLNEIKVADYYWMNPYRFKETPYFIRIGSVALRFDIATLFAAILDPSKSVDIVHFEIEDVEVYVEKGKRDDGLNIWAALGAVNEKNEEEVLKRVQKSIKASLRLTTGAVKTVANVPVAALKTVVKYNPVTLVAKGVINAGSAMVASSQKTSAGVSTPTSASTPTSIVSAAETSIAKENLLRSPSDLQPRRNSLDNSTSGRRQSYQSTRGGTVAGNSSSGKSMWGMFSAASQGDKEDLAGDESAPEDDASVGDDDHDIWRTSPGYESDDHGGDEHTETASTPNECAGSVPIPGGSSNSVSAKKEGPPPHWGIPFVFNVKRLTIRDVKVFAQDYLNAKHSEAASQNAIVLDLISMSHRELSRRGKTPDAPREGLYLDEIVWRGVGRLVNEVLSTNKVAMLQVVTSAALNQTTHVVQGAAHMTSVKVAETVYNYNPKELFHGTKQIFQNMLQHSVVEPSSEVKVLGINKIRVRLFKARSAMYKNDRVKVPLFCTFTMRNQDGCLEDSMVSTHRQPDREDGTEAVFEETFTLIPLVSLDAVVHLRLYKSNLLLKDTCIGEAFLSLRSELVDRRAKKSNDGGSNKGTSSSGRSESDMARAVRLAEEMKAEGETRSIGLQCEVFKWHSLSLKTPGCSGELLLGISAIQ